MKIAFALVLSAALMASLACDDLGQLKQSGFNECVECDLSGANLTWTYLYGANLTGANLAGVDLSGNDLTGANLTEANLFGANLTGADLTGADLGVANLIGANLTGADLTLVVGADFSGALNVPDKYVKD